MTMKLLILVHAVGRLSHQDFCEDNSENNESVAV